MSMLVTESSPASSKVACCRWHSGQDLQSAYLDGAWDQRVTKVPKDRHKIVQIVERTCAFFVQANKTRAEIS
jgi:hypothetical protein